MFEIATFYEPVKKQVLKLVMLKTDEIELPPFQRDLSESLRKHLELAIDKLGFLTPIIVTQIDGRFYVIDGQHRLEAIKSLGVSEIPAIVVDENLYHHILDFNTERPPNVREKAKQAYRLYMDLFNRDSKEIESNLYGYLRDPVYVTLGFAIEEFDSKFPAGFYDEFVAKIDGFLDVPLREAVEERRKRAEALLELNREVHEKYARLGVNNPLLKGEILRKGIQQAYGVRVRVIADDFYEAVRRVAEAVRNLQYEVSEEI